MNALGVLTAVLASMSLMLTSSILIHGKRSKNEVFYALIAIFASVWAFGLAFISNNLILPFVFFKFITIATYIAADLAFLSFFWFAIYYPVRTIRSLTLPLVKTVFHGFILLTIIFWPSLIFSSLQVSGPLNERFVFNQSHFTYLVYAVFAMSAFYLGELILIRNYRNLGRDFNRNFRSILITGTFFAGSVGFVGNLILPFFGNFYAWALGPIFVILPFFGTSVYLVFKYRFFNIKVIAAELLMLAIWLFIFVKFLSEVAVREQLVDGLLLILIIAFGVFLVRSVLTEIKQKEQLEMLNTELKDLNENLEQKVSEQTQEIRQSYEVEKKARQDLEELDKAKDQFILTTQHHLRTPLTIVKGYVQSLLGMAPEKTIGESKNVIVKAAGAADRLGSLINELLDVSEMNFRQGNLVKKMVDPKKVIEEIIMDLKPEMEKKNLQITLDAPMELSINLDSAKFKEAITNIIDNSVKYGHQGGNIGIKIEKFTHPIERDKQSLRIIVQDNGIGIPQEELSKLFMSYFERGEEARKVYATGRGIGLVITKNIIAAHGGKIWAESEGKGKGSKFTIELPAN